MTECVIITGMRAPVAMDLARSFSALGWRVIGADSCRWPVGRFSNAVGRYHQLPAPAEDHHAFGQALARLAGEEDAKLILPTCEEIFYIARHKDLLPCPIFSPDLDQLTKFHDKGRLPEIASGLGVQVPVTLVCESVSELKDAYREMSGDCVYKPAFSRFASHVRFPKSAEDFVDPLPSKQMPWVCQQHVSGQEACVYAIAQAGRLTAIAAYRPIWRIGQGSGICFQPIMDPILERFCLEFAKRFQLTGQISFDLIQNADGVWHVIECNPRATSGLHLFQASADLANRMIEKEGDLLRTQGSKPMMVSAAMILFGWRHALKAPELFKQYCSLYREGSDVVSRSGDRLPALAQILSVGEVLAKSVYNRNSPLVQATNDIEWNGTPLT